MPFTVRNLKQDLEDVGSNFDGARDLEFRLATDALELEQSGLRHGSPHLATRLSVRSHTQDARGRYVAVRGSGRMKLDDEIVELSSGTRCAFRRARGGATKPAPKASR